MVLIVFLVMSVGSAFAVDDIATDTVALDDQNEIMEIANDDSTLEEVDEPVLNEEDNDVVAATPETVTKDTFFNYFESDGNLKSNVTSEELVFEGEFTIPDVHYITIDKPIKLTGNNAVLNNLSIIITANDVVFDSFTVNTDDATNAFYISEANNVKIINNNITFNAVGDDDSACTIYVDAAEMLTLQNNRIVVTGNRSGNKAVYFVDCAGAVVDGNEFVAAVPSVGYPYPSYGMGGAVLYFFGETDDLKFVNNNVTVVGTPAGDYPTSVAVAFTGSRVLADNNNIICSGDLYSYAIVDLGINTTISNSVIKASSSNYACGIDLEGSGISTVANNEIITVSDASAYGIYSGMTSGGLVGVYSDNNISVDGYFAVGVSISSFDETIIGNNINATGNYTIGVAAGYCNSYDASWTPISVPIKNRLVKDNTINSLGSNVGTDATGDSYFKNLESTGITTLIGNLTLEKNNIVSSDKGIYATAADNLSISSNYVRVVSNKSGSKIVSFVDCMDAVVNGNIFAGVMPSTGYQSGAIHFNDGTSDLMFSNNLVNVKAIPEGGYPTTVGVAFAGENVTLSDNVIYVANDTYSYAVCALGKDSKIVDNIIVADSPNYACGVNLEGSSLTVVDNNNITAISDAAAYGIYSGMTNGGLVGVYSNNNISASGYFAVGASISSFNETVIGNEMNLAGNYTIGVAAGYCSYYDYSTSSSVSIPIVNRLVKDNVINSEGSNVGTDATGDWVFTNLESTGISAVTGNLTLENNTIYSTNVGIYATAADNLIVRSKNSVSVVSNKSGSKIISLVDCMNAVVDDNAFVGVMPSTGYQTGAIHFNDATSDLIFSNNAVYVKGIPEGGYPTTIGVAFAGNNVTLRGNTIFVGDDVYSYAVCALGSDSKIVDNIIVADSPNYACGVNLEGSSLTVVDNNNITAISDAAAYGIYSGMTNGGLVGVYSNNNISASGYFAVGASISSFNETVIGNEMNLAGNYTIGVAAGYCNYYDYSTSSNVPIPIVNRLVKDNVINSMGSNVGTDATGDWVFTKLESTGITDVAGNLTIDNNTIVTTGDYAVVADGQNVTVSDNYLAGKKGVGENSVKGNDVTVSGSKPELKTILSAVPFYTVYDEGDIYYVTAMDENGDPIKNANIVLNINGTIFNETTDNLGVASFYLELPVGQYDVDISYAGNDTFGPKTAKGFIQVESRVSNIIAPTSVNVLVTAIKNGYNYKFTLTDDRGNGLANENVVITFNGKTETVSTDSLGVVNYKLVATKAGTQKLTIKFDSDKNYVSSTLTATVKISKEATKLTAKKKTFKAKVKTKKYAVTLKDSKGKAIKKVKLTLKVKGKTYKATTNAKGKATFKIKNLKKKGKYTAKVTFAGNDLYNKVAKSVKITVKK